MPIEDSGVVWLRENWEELRGYNYQWVAASGDGLIATDPSLEAVIVQVVELGVAEQAVYTLVDFEEELH